MAIHVLIMYLLQTVLTVGTVFLFGWLISVCNKLFYRSFGSNGKIACYVTGFIGTPVHELSHAVFCIVFGHKITEIKLFQINSEDGVLGYVNHSYNPKNIYHKIGNYFIGIAPIIVISLILFGLCKLLVPDMLDTICAQTEILSASLDFKGVVVFLVGVVKAVFDSADLLNWWIFVLIGSLLSLHMTMSKADLKGALSGLIFVLTAVLLADVIFALISQTAFMGFALGFLQVACVLNSMLMLSFAVSVIAAVLSFSVCAAVKRIVKKRSVS